MSYEELEGPFGGINVEATAFGFLLGLTYQFSPGADTNPFVGIGIGVVETEVTASVPGLTAKSDSTDFAATLGGGVEIAISAMAAISPSIEVQTVDDESDVFASLPLNIWFNDRVYGLLAAAYGFDDGDVLYGFGLGFGI